MGSSGSRPSNPPRYSVSNNNLLSQTRGAVDGKVSGSFQVGGIGDPAVGCGKSYVASYKCGTGPLKGVNISPEASGKVASFTCTAEDAACLDFVLTLGDDGYIELNKSDGTSLWRGGGGKTGIPLPQYRASKGKYGRNSLRPGESISVGEFIGSPSGNCTAEVVNTGNGDWALAIVYRVLGCGDGSGPATETAGSYGMAGNSEGNYGFYKADPVNIGSLQTMGMTTDAGTVEVIPGSMRSVGHEFFRVPGAWDAPGNDLASSGNATAESCKRACAADRACAGVVYDQSTAECFTKDADMYPRGERIANKNRQIFIRQQTVDSASSCPEQVDEATADQYNRLDKVGTMTKSSQCLMADYIANQQKIVADKAAKMEQLAMTLNDNVSSLKGEEHKLDAKLLEGLKDVQRDLKAYEKLHKSIPKARRDVVSADGQLEDSSLDMLSESSHYLLLTLLGIVTVGLGIKAAA